MNMITIAICDRNNSETRALQKYLRQLFPGADIRFFDRPDLLLQTIQKGQNPYRAIFLRMEALGLNGIETARQIRQRDRFVPLIILCGCEKYYKEAFEVFAWQYMLTPVSLEDVERVMEPLKQMWGNMEERVLYYRYRSRLYTLPHSSILYISSNLHTVNFYLRDGSCVHCRGKLDNFQDQLANSSFLRCHQSFYVNMDAVTSMRKDGFVVNGEVVPVSRSYIRDAQDQYYQYLRKQGREEGRMA